MACSLAIAFHQRIPQFRLQPIPRLTSAFLPWFPSGMLQRHTPEPSVMTALPTALVLVLITSPTGAGRTGV